MLRVKLPTLSDELGLIGGARHLALAVICAATVLLLGAVRVPTADAKEPGARYCFRGHCHRVGSLAQTETLVGWRGYVLASYYDDCRLDRLNPCGLTSSGAVFRPDLPDNAASPLLPDGTVILAYNPRTGDASVLRITNAGPYSGERKLDVSRAAASNLGFRKQGVAPLVISVLHSPTRFEASYVRRRVYPGVPGHLGKFETFDAALEAAEAGMGAGQARAQTAGIETGALGTGLDFVPRPRLAVSPALARALVMLRTAPRPVKRARLVRGPRLASAVGFRLSRSHPSALERIDFAAGLRRSMGQRDGE